MHLNFGAKSNQGSYQPGWSFRQSQANGRSGVLREIQMYIQSLASADFSGAVFTCTHFQKIAQISSLCDFHYITEGLKCCEFGSCGFLPDLKKCTSQGPGVHVLLEPTRLFIFEKNSHLHDYQNLHVYLFLGKFPTTRSF